MTDTSLVRIQIRHLFTTGKWSVWVPWESGVRGDYGVYPLWKAKQHLEQIGKDKWCEGRLIDAETKLPLELE